MPGGNLNRDHRWDAIAIQRTPAIQEVAQPSADREVVDWAIDKMLIAGFGARQREPLPAARRPAAHHGVGDFRVKLDAVRRAPVTKCLHLEDFACGEQRGPGWKRERFPGPET